MTLLNVASFFAHFNAGDKLLREVITTTDDGGTPTEKVLDFFYDESGRPFAVKIDNVLYYYITNLQGDVMQVVNSNGTAVATYEYDPYGNIISATGSLTETSPCATVDMYMTVTKTPIDSDTHPRSYKFRVGTE